MGTHDSLLTVLPDRPAESPTDASIATLVTIVSMSEDGTPGVHLDDDGPAVPARLALRTTRARLEKAIADRQATLVVFENGDRTKPLIIGFVEPLDQPQPVATPDAPIVEADVDGRRVRVTAQDEIVLQCGNASITLRRNGRVVIHGTYVETRSDGTNRIKGGQVQIN